MPPQVPPIGRRVDGRIVFDEPVSMPDTSLSDSTTHGVENLLQPEAFWIPKARVLPANQHIFSRFDGGVATEWVKSGTGEAVDDTTEVLMGSKSIKITVPTGNVALTKTLAQAFDLSNYDKIVLRFKIDGASTGTGLIRVQFYEGTNYRYDAPTINTTNFVYGRWIEHVIDRARVTAGSAEFNWAAVDKININWTTNADSNFVVYYTDITARKNTLTKPVVIFNFDDGGITSFTKAAPKLSEYGWGGVAFIVGSLVGTAGYMTVAQLRALQDYHGWDIGSHTYNHNYVDGTTTAAAIEKEIRRNLYFMKANGLRSGLRYFAWPGGARNAMTIEVAERYHTLIRSTVTTAGLHAGHPLTNPTDLRSASIAAAQNLATAQAHVDNVITATGSIILLFHGFVDAGATGTQWNIGDFNSLVDYIASKEVDVLTFSQYLDLYGL